MMRRGGLGILIFLVVSLLVAFLLMKHMQNPTAITDKAAQAAADAAGQIAQSVAEAVQNSGLTDMLQDTISQMGGGG